MDWASNLFVVLLLANITGTIFFLFGRVFKRQAENDVVFLRFLTEATLFAYLVPFVYIMLYLGKRLSTIKVKSDINLFYGTPLMLEFSAVLGCAWLGLFLGLLIYRLYRRRGWINLCKGNIPEEDEKIIQVFEDVCAGFGIGGEVSLCRNDSVDVPYITYYHGFVVMLPFKKYTEKEAEIIFCHELCHYLNGDLYLKAIGCITALLHVFNPAVHILMRELDMLCERCCDRSASKKGEYRFTMQEYFQVIFDALVDTGKKDRYQLFALADDKLDYERRVEYMKDYRASGGLKRGTAVALAACFLLGSSITSLAAGDGVTDAYEGLADSTSVRSTYEETGAGDSDVMDEEALEVLSRVWDIDPADVVFMDDSIETYSSYVRVIEWTVPAGKTYVSTGFTEYPDDEVIVVVYGTPEDVEYQMGLKDPKAIMWYVEGSGKVDQKFVIKLKGRHYFFVTNLSETDKLDVEAYILR